MRVGVLRGSEDSLAYALLARVNSIGKGVFGEFVQLGGTRLGEPIPYRVIVDRMSHRVPYYAAYLEMAALQGAYCINNVFSRAGGKPSLAAAAAEKLGLAAPKTVVLPAKAYPPGMSGECLRNLWPVDFAGALDHVGVPCLMRPAVGHGCRGAVEIHSHTELMERYDASGETTMMLQERLEWDVLIHVLSVGRQARAARCDSTVGERLRYRQDEGALPARLRDEAEERALAASRAFGYDLNVVELGFKDGLFYGLSLADDEPELEYRRLGDAHFPWLVEKLAELVVDTALTSPPMPQPDWTALTQAD